VYLCDQPCVKAHEELLGNGRCLTEGLTTLLTGIFTRWRLMVTEFDQLIESLLMKKQHITSLLDNIE
jgi:hypothetical protein